VCQLVVLCEGRGRVGYHRSCRRIDSGNNEATPPHVNPTCGAPHFNSSFGVRETRRLAALLCYDSATSAVSSTIGVATGFFAWVVVMTTTLTRTSRVPRIVRRPRASPPRK
jgi:hypothetical protein